MTTREKLTVLADFLLLLGAFAVIVAILWLREPG